jgi:hypothetical protein
MAGGLQARGRAEKRWAKSLGFGTATLKICCYWMRGWI